MTEDEYDKFLNKDFRYTKEYRDRYGEIAADKCDQIERIYSKRLPNKYPILDRIYNYNWFANRHIVWKFLSIFVTSLLLAFLLPIPSEKVIRDSAGNIFTAFVALLGLLAVFFVFKTELQRDRVGGDLDTMTSLFHNYEKRELESTRSRSTTKEMVRCFHEKLRWGKEELREPWIHMVNQLYISHVNRDYFTRNLYLFIFIIVLSLGLMIGIPFPEHFEIHVWEFSRIEWNTFWFSLDIVLAFSSIVYLFHTLMVMTKHVYLKDDLRRIHESERGMWGPDYESHRRTK